MFQNSKDDIENALTEEEKIACKEAFDSFDKDGDGCLDERELKKILEGPLKTE